MTDILPEDREAAERIAVGQPFTCFDCADELAISFARHRIAAAQKARQKAIEQCAEICEAAVNNADDWDSSYWDQACTNRAFAIRRLNKGLQHD